MYKVKTINKIAPAGISVLEDRGIPAGADTENPDALLVRSVNLHDERLGPELMCIARAGAGTNNIPVDRCTQEGIAVFNTPGANADAVKELVICSLLMSSRDILGGIEWVRSIAGCGDEITAMVENSKSSFTGPEIMNKTLGVVGLGAVGAKIANTAIALGMRVYGYDPYLSVDAAWQLSGEVIHAHDLDTIYRNCDYITIHVPYMKDTHHMIDAEAISKMRDGVRIINLARGELVCDDDIIDALDSTKVARYITDFPNAKTAGLPNVVPMPHIGASTPESEEKCAIMAAEEIAEYLINGNVINSVNFPAARLERMGVSRICAFHRNVPRILNKLLELIGEKDINIEHMINKPRGEYAYTIIDTGAEVGSEMAAKIAGMSEVLRVRIL